jgi:hypothetical protein
MKQSTITKLLPVAIVGLVLGALYSSLTVTAQEASSFNTKIYFTDGGDTLNVASGGAVKVAGTPLPLPEIKANYVAVTAVLVAGTPTPGVHTFMGGVNIVPTFAAGAAGLLPTDGTTSGDVEVINTGANEINVCPGSGDTITAGGTAGSANVCVGVAALGNAKFRALSASSWYAVAAAAAATPGN